jgi:hypothetical protein
VKTGTPKTLYDPIAGVRRQSEWDDHGETYARTAEGPDIWVSLKVPAGVQRVSLYFMNKDGHGGSNRLRDYHIALYDGPMDITMEQWKSPLAQARVRDFWGGVYEQFVVRRPGDYCIQIARNGSHNTIVSAVLVDRVHGQKTQFDEIPLAWLGGVRYDPPELTELPSAGAGYAALRAWLAMDAATATPAATALQTPSRRLTFRAEASAGGSQSLLANWRWALRLWTQRDRDEFNDAMDRGWAQQVKISPNMVWEKRRSLGR